MRRRPPKLAASSSYYIPSLTFGTQILDGDGQEHTRDTPEEKALMRRLAADSIVLLKNDGNILPLKPKVSSFSRLVSLSCTHIPDRSRA